MFFVAALGYCFSFSCHYELSSIAVNRKKVGHGMTAIQFFEAAAIEQLSITMKGDSAVSFSSCLKVGCDRKRSTV